MILSGWQLAFATVYFLYSSLHYITKMQTQYIEKTTGTTFTLYNKSSSGDDIPERDVTYHLICLLMYH